MTKLNPRKRSVKNNEDEAGESATSEKRKKLDNLDHNASESLPALGTTADGHSTKGLKPFLHGISYQVKLTILILLHAAKLKKTQFRITSEDTSCGKFDDIVFRCKNEGKWHALYLQAKHRVSEQKTGLTWKNCTSRSQAASSALGMYFRSFSNLKWNPADASRELLVYCTNVGVAGEVRKLMIPYAFNSNIIGGIFEPLSADVFKFNVDNFKEQHRKDLLEHCKEHSDCVRLARQLAKCIYTQTKIDLRNPMFKKYGYVIQKQIATDKLLPQSEADKNAFCVNENFLNVSTVSRNDFKKVFESEYQKLANSTLNVWEDVRQKGIFLPVKFGTTQFENANGEAELPSEVKFHEVENFMNSFVLVCNTKSEASITDVIMEKLKSSKEGFLPCYMQGFVEPELANDFLSKTLINWIKKKENTALLSKDIDEFFKLFVAKLYFLHCKGISNICFEKIQNMGLKFEPTKLEATQLYKTCSRKTHEIEVLVSSQHPVIVWHVLELLKHEYEYIFLEGNTFATMQSTIMDVFKTMKFPMILVIDCKENPIDVDFIQLFQGKSWPDRRTVIVLQENPAGVILQEENPSTIDDNFLFEDLMPESREMIYDRNKELKLFGTSVNFRTILRPEDTLTFFLELTSPKDELQVRQSLNERPFEKIKHIYIQRRWHSCEDEQEKTGKNYGIRRNANMLSSMRNLESVLANESERMCVIQLVENITNRRITEKIYKENQKRVMPPGDNNTVKVHIFLNDAGQGKSFYITWLAQDLQMRHPSWWIIKINLIEYSALLSELAKTYTQSELPQQEALRIMLQLAYLAFYAPNINFRSMADTYQERSRAKECADCLVLTEGQVQLDRSKCKNSVTSQQLALLLVFEQKYNSKEIVILFDGFDEIAPDYKDMGLSLLSGLAKLEGILKIYLTSRPYDLKKDFQTAMPRCQFIRLKTLWRPDKKEFLLRHLNNFPNYARYKPAVRNALMRLLTKLTDELLGDLSCVPLLLAMALATFVPLVMQHMDLETCTIAPKVLKECESMFELLLMMETFVEKKLAVSTEKTGTTDTAAHIPAAKLDAQTKLRTSKTVHSLLAMYVFLNEEDRELLLNEQERDNALDYMKLVSDGSEKSGIVDGVVNKVPMFIHRTFAEYFAAFWLFNNKDREEVKKYIKRNLFENDNRIEIRHFLDRMLCREHPLHMAVLDGSKAKVKHILKQDPAKAIDMDDWERTPLHLTVLYFKSHLDWKKVLDALVQAQKGAVLNVIDKQDAFMQRSAMDYAFALGKDDYAKSRLLKNGASVNTDTLLDRLLTDDPVSTLCNAAVLENELMNLTKWCLSRTKANSLFERVVEKLIALPSFDLYNRIPRAKLPDPMPIAMVKKMNRLGKVKHNHGAFTLLQFCAVFDSSALLRNLVKRTNPSKLAKYNQSLYMVAMEYCSVRVLQYLIIECKYNPPEKIMFDQLVRTLMFCIQESAMGLFKYLYDKYCTWYNVDCLQENELPAATGNGESDEENEWVDSCDWLDVPDVPEEFQSTDRGMDTGTKSLLVKAMRLNNLQATMYLTQKVHLDVTNAFIISLFATNYKVGWHCERSVHFLVDHSQDLRANNEATGRNLLHHAAQYGWFCLAKCLIEHFDFDGKQINERENNWNAFFYCVAVVGSMYGSQQILTFLMERYAADCFHQKDTNGRNVFYYAVKNNTLIARHILKLKCQQLTDQTLEATVATLLQLMQETGLTHAQINTCIGWITEFQANGIRFMPIQFKEMFHAALQHGSIIEAHGKS